MIKRWAKMYNDGYYYNPYQNYQTYYQPSSGIGTFDSGSTPSFKRGFGLTGLFRRNKANDFVGITTGKAKFNWSNLLNNTQKTLNVINQAIPIFYQVRPIWNNAKTMFKIMGAIKEDDAKDNNESEKKEEKIKEEAKETTFISNHENQPQFFL